MIQAIDTGNVKTVMRDGLRMFDIEFSYAIDANQRKRAIELLNGMVAAYNAEEINAINETAAALKAQAESPILRFTNATTNE